MSQIEWRNFCIHEIPNWEKISESPTGVSAASVSDRVLRTEYMAEARPIYTLGASTV